MSQQILLYHRVPEQLHGNTIFPGNQLPEPLRSRAMAKYAGRERLTQKRVDPLDCLWNDAVQTLAVHPIDVARLMRDCGFSKMASRPQRWFTIPLEHLDQSQLAVFRHDELIDRIGVGCPPAEWMTTLMPLARFEQFDPAAIDAYRRIPAMTGEYFRFVRRRWSQGWTAMPLMPFQFVPHVFYRGPIRVTDIPVETVHLAD